MPYAFHAAFAMLAMLITPALLLLTLVAVHADRCFFRRHAYADATRAVIFRFRHAAMPLLRLLMLLLFISCWLRFFV